MILLAPSPLRSCASCRHWNCYFTSVSDGIVHAICGQDGGNLVARRGSERCGKWEPRP
jgi:hypothetical protein